MYIGSLLFLFVYCRPIAAFSFYRHYRLLILYIYTSVFVGFYDHMLAPYRSPRLLPLLPTREGRDN